jgi:hypothetical protein
MTRIAGSFFMSGFFRVWLAFNLLAMLKRLTTTQGLREAPMKSKKLLCFFSLIMMLSLLFSANEIFARSADNFNYRPDHEVYQNRPVISKDRRPANDRERILQLFAFLDEFELLFQDIKFLNVIARLPRLKNSYRRAMNLLKRIQHRLTPDLKILVQIYAAKYKLFIGLGNIFKDMRIDSGYRNALIRSGLAALSLYNQVIDRFRESEGFDEDQYSQLKSLVKTIPKRLQKYSVTSKYLLLDNEKIPGGQQIMVLEIQENRAMVLFMGPTLTNHQIEGWLSLRELEKRTTWEKMNRIFFEQ